ncbi:hypothetical protein D3C72_1418830 [compost metagenome]
MECSTAWMLKGLGSIGWRREKVSSRCVRCAARFADSMATLMKRCACSGLSPASLRWIRYKAPVIPWSILLKSCAIPPVNRPTASIFCDCRSAFSVSSRVSACAFRSESSRPVTYRLSCDHDMLQVIQL